MSDCTLTENVLNAFKKAPIQLLNPIKISDTLQGSIWRASTTDNSTVVVKVTDRSQYTNSTATFNNKVYHNIKEDIVLEQSILKHLTQREDCPESLTKFIAFFETDDLYLFIQQDGGYSLFDFVRNAHKLIRTGTINISHWHAVIKVIFKQLLQSIAFIHSKNVCHNDISLENVLINDVQIVAHGGEEGTIYFKTDQIQIKLCDFGLAESHNNPECLSNKHCGKRQYKSPEIYDIHKRFDGKKNDIWAIGVCLFILAFGYPPWNVPHLTDDLFVLMTSGRMMDVLRSWGLSAYIDLPMIDLLQSVFEYEADRISVSQMTQHNYFSN
eukprot:42269_1